MPQAKPKRYKLIFYGFMLDRWWEALLFLGLVLILYVSFLWGAEWYYIDPAANPFIRLDNVTGVVLLGLGIIIAGFAIFLAFARNGAYVQPDIDHFKIVTPFYSVSISYKRIQSTRTAEFGSLFPPKSLNSYKRELVSEFARNTAIVVHLVSYPVPQKTLKLFLSPFFFYDNTPHFVLLVEDWMSFSAALESYRISGKLPHNPAIAVKPTKSQNVPRQQSQSPKPRSGMLANLPKDDKKK